jgi:hypothetical protein
LSRPIRRYFMWSHPDGARPWPRPTTDPRRGPCPLGPTAAAPGRRHPRRLACGPAREPPGAATDASPCCGSPHCRPPSRPRTPPGHPSVPVSRRRAGPATTGRRALRAGWSNGSPPSCSAGRRAAAPVTSGVEAQADSSERPLRRRAARMARPARVLIRRRKPWVRLRRRRLGWKVRLLTGGLPYLLGERLALHYRPPSTGAADSGRWCTATCQRYGAVPTRSNRPSSPTCWCRRVRSGVSSRHAGAEQKSRPAGCVGSVPIASVPLNHPPVAIPPCHEVEEIRAWLSHATLPGREVGPGYCPPLHAQGVDKCVE